jgi:NADH:ubiquinone oxidoreductase subunit 6 (subunit J)
MAVVIFWVLALLTIGSAVMTVVARNILHAAVALAFAFMGVAGLYLFLHADFVAATQLIVYVGGIIVLVIFAVMFSAHILDDTGEVGGRPLAYGAAGLVALFVIASLVLSARHLQPDLVKARYPQNEAQRAASSEAGYRESKLVERHPPVRTHRLPVTVPPAPSPVPGAAPVPAPAPTTEVGSAAVTPAQASSGDPVNDFSPATKSIGVMLLGKYLLAFEAVSILLLAVVVAAVVLVRKETAREGSAQG